MVRTGAGAESYRISRLVIPAIRKAAGARLARGVAWSVLGSVVSQGASLLSAVILAHILGKQVFGQYAMIQSTVMALTTLAGLGFGLTGAKFVSQFRTSEPERVGRILGLSVLVVMPAALLFAIGLLVCAPWLRPAADPSGVFAVSLRWSALYVFFVTASGYQTGVLAGFEAFRKIAGITSVYGILALLLSWAGAVGWGIRGAVAGQSVAAILLWAAYQSSVAAECRASHIRIRYRGVWQESDTLLSVSIPAAACGALLSATGWAGSAILARSAGYAELAVFSAASNMRSLVLFLPAIITRVMSPRLNHILAFGDHRGYRRTFWFSTALNGGLAVATASGISFVGKPFLRLFGKEFVGSPGLVLLVLGAAVAEVIALNLYLALFTSGHFWRNLGVIAVWSLVLTGCAGLAAPRLGASGLALAYLAAWSTAAALYAIAAFRQMRRLPDGRAAEQV